MLRSARRLLAEGAQRFFIVHPRSSIVHPEASTCRIDDRSGGVVILARQCPHGLYSGYIESPLEMPESPVCVGRPLP
eukprot:3855806-Amphidinium_carterae.2